MLTQSDITALRKVIREEIGNEVKDAKKTLESQLILTQADIRVAIDDVDDRLKNVAITLDDVQKNVKRSKKDIAFIKKTINIVIGDYDQRDNKLKKRVTRLEDHLGLPANN